MVDLDLKYIQEWSLLYDKIILKTVKIIDKPNNTY